MQKPTARRLLTPILMILGSLACAYTAFFIGVKEELPQPTGAIRHALPVNQQITVLEQWSQSTGVKVATAELFALRDDINKSADFYRQAYVEKRGWRELAAPDQPRDKASNQQFIMLYFVKDNNSVIIALTTGENIYDNENIFQKVLRVGSTKKSDNLALVVNWVKR